MITRVKTASASLTWIVTRVKPGFDLDVTRINSEEVSTETYISDTTMIGSACVSYSND